MNYEEALQYIHGVEKFGMNLGLESIGELLKRMGDPQKKLKFVHIAGTNGKGSTANYIATVLSGCGYKTGLYTSPYLERFNERIIIDGKDIEDDELVISIESVKKAADSMVSDRLDHPTEFELVTAVAFDYFYRMNTEVVVLEVGLGGRYDATNIIDSPLVSVIASISMDHMNVLGNTIEKIAFEKAGIIKKGIDVVVYDQSDEVLNVIRDVCSSMDSKILISGGDYIINKSTISQQVFDFKDYIGNIHANVKIRMIGEHQVRNAILAINTLVYLRENCGFDRLSDTSIFSNTQNARWKGRLEVMKESPLVIIDGAHNYDGARSLAETIDLHFDESWEKILVFGALADKEVDKIIKTLMPKFDRLVVTLPDNPRAMQVEEIAMKSSSHLKESGYEENIICIEDKNMAYDYAIKWASEMKSKQSSNKKNSKNKKSKKGGTIDDVQKKQVIICAGSLYMIGGLRTHIASR